MAATGYVYNVFKLAALNGSIGDLTSETVKMLLVDTTYTFDAAHEILSDISGDEMSGTGYTAGFAGSGRKTLGTKTATQDDTNDRALFGCADITWAATFSPGTIGGAVVFHQPSSASDDGDCIPIAFWDLGGEATDGNAFTLYIDGAEKLLQVY